MNIYRLRTANINVSLRVDINGVSRRDNYPDGIKYPVSSIEDVTLRDVSLFDLERFPSRGVVAPC